MDAGTLGSIVTVLFFVLFVAILWWTFHRGNKQKFEDAGNLPFQEDARDAGKRLTD
jgi:cytochrome c oxidase cbb3-type subunit 4